MSDASVGASEASASACRQVVVSHLIAAISSQQSALRSTSKAYRSSCVSQQPLRTFSFRVEFVLRSLVRSNVLHFVRVPLLNAPAFLISAAAQFSTCNDCVCQTLTTNAGSLTAGLPLQPR